jgi:hypothetical protein
MSIESLVVDLSKDPFNPQLNFACAVEYHRLNQTASAVSFYLRTAEYGEGDLVYNSLLRVAQCFEDQNDRVHTVSNCILQAVAYMPERPEAYFLMSQFHERNGNWQECYTWAKMGSQCAEHPPLPASVGYHGSYCLEFETAVSSWWIGRKEESKALLDHLNSMTLAPEYEAAINANLERLW